MKPELMGQPRALFALLVVFMGVVAAAIISNNGTLRPLNGNEIFVAQTASEMLERDEYLVPHFAGELRLEKPPLPYWLSVAAHEAFGEPGTTRVTEFEARLRASLCGILLIAVTFLLGTTAFEDRRVGLAAAAIIGTSWQFFTYGRSARPEMIYALFCTLQMLGMVIAARRELEGRSSLPGAVLAWLATAAALLSKGPQFPLFLLLGAMLALWLSKPRPSLRRVLRPAIGAAAVAVVLVYFAYLATQTEGAASFWIQQTTQIRSMSDPLWLRPLRFFYPWSLVLAMAPWGVALGLAVVQCWKYRHTMALMLGFGVLVSLFFLGFAGVQREYYVLPLTPLCAVLAGWAAVALYDRARADETARKLMTGLLVAQAALVGGMLIASGWRAQRGHPVTGQPMLADALPWLLAGVVLVCAALVIVRRRPEWAFGAVVASILTAWTAFSNSGLDVSRYWATAAEFAVKVAKLVPADKPLLFDGTRANAIVYYGNRRHSRMALRDWIAANGTANLPLLICLRECRLKGYELEGNVLLQQRYIEGQATYMILFEPFRIRALPPKSSSDHLEPSVGLASGRASL